MDRKELIRSLVLDAIANDYENFDTIAAEVSSWGCEHSVLLDRTEILEVLNDLVISGLAQAYRLSPQGIRQETEYTYADAADCYFFITQKGRLAIHEY